MTIVDGKECFEFEDDYSYAYFVRTITFGFKSDYINKINGTYFKCDVEDVDIIGVFVTNPNLGKEYNEYDYAKECTFVAKDERQYLIDLYILSDKLIKIKCENDEECGLFQMYGLGVSTDSGNYLSVGAVEEIKFENFDTSDNNNFNCMFNFCYIKKLDISNFIIKKEATFDDFFKDCFITDGETAVKYPDNFPDEYKYKADNAQTEE